MSNLERIQKGMKVFQILSKIILITSFVGFVLTSISTTLIATNILNENNQFLHFISVTTTISKDQIIMTLIATAISLLVGSILTFNVYHYFTTELREGTPFTQTGAKRITQLGILFIITDILEAAFFATIEKYMSLYTRFDNGSNISLGICLLLIAFIIRYGAELEQKSHN